MACRDGVIQVIFSRDPLVLGKSAGQSESTISGIRVVLWSPATEFLKEIGWGSVSRELKAWEFIFWKRELQRFSVKKVWASSRSGRNFENRKNLDFHGLGHVESPLWPKNRRLRCAAHNVLKNKTWLVEMVYSRSNTLLPAALCRPSRRNRKFYGAMWFSRDCFGSLYWI